jgi:outer membrane protein assembly factor BamB
MTTRISALPPHVAISSSRVYATQGGVYALDRQHGTLLQSYPIKGVRASVVIGDVLYANAASISSQIATNLADQLDPLKSGLAVQAIQAFHTNDGTQLWSYPAQQLTEAPVVVNGIVYASDLGKGCVYAISAHSGTLLWSYQTGKSLYTLPMIAGGVVYLTPTVSPPEQAYVYAVRARHGSQLWRVPIPEASSVPLVADDGMVYVCTHRRCSALQGWDGSLLWQHEYAPEGASSTHPVEKDGVLYVGGSILSRPILQDDVLYLCLHGIGYVQGEPGSPEDFAQRIRRTLYLYALDTRYGDLLWERPLAIPSVPQPGFQETLSTGQDGYIYLGGNDGALYAISTEDGSILWRYQTGGETLSPAIQADDLVYVGASDGYVYALNADDGVLRWRSFVSVETITSYNLKLTRSNKP